MDTSSAFFPHSDPNFREKLLSFLQRYPDAAFLDSHKGTIPVTGIRYRYLSAGGCIDSISSGKLADLEAFLQKQRDAGRWVFGFLTYDLKNEIEELNSANPDHTGFPLFHFFVPEWVVTADDSGIRVSAHEISPEKLYRQINDVSLAVDSTIPPVVSVSHITGRESYLKSVETILGHLRRGDIYEVNFCRQLAAQTRNLDPLWLYQRLSAAAPAPFACYYKTGPWHLVCASPERFIARRGNKLYSQPMKGTAARDSNPVTDEAQKSRLANSEKERAENVMIVDLVRNDLSRIASPGSVKVEELFGVYSFPNVHQMISTISCSLQNKFGFTDVIKALFPMGSMTGAPKISAMKIIEEQEDFRRSLFSGSAGYIDPSGDFDFNVVIRSILYNTSEGIVTVAAGGAITAQSDPVAEFEETALKMKPQLEALGIDLAVMQSANPHAQQI